ncbi:carboxylate--amine ligase [Actinomadura craniellae]|uniref:Putative glutamate--cysteine ligase 2 n=1 Tax=Actinomadura craniellae TaxID=2231787 RepID=A0A365HDH7_9ACTN|nr:glutamate--cysteine ligase [Actinomadura craniellae]RAY17184.1 carboxylate--amine ligase [Actinomadura craniellae]
MSGLTMGVEEEFLLVDPGSGRAVPCAAAVLARAGREPCPPGAELHPELSATQVEATTGVCTDLAGLRDHLRAGRHRLAAAARAEGVLLISSGTPVVAAPPPPHSSGERFAEIVRRYAGVVDGYQTCGCHVHVGVPDAGTGVAVVNHLRPWLPTLLALSANSPFGGGRDTGYASWRILEQSSFPGAGTPPWFPSAAAYRREVDRLVECGTLVDSAMTFWLARPSPHLPTVEVRAADAAATADEALLQAALVRGLVRTALDDLAAGREAPRVGDPVCAAAVWSAARYGLGGPGVHPLEEHRVPAVRLVAELVDRVRPALEEAGDLAPASTLLAGALRRGTGADRQRRAAAGAGGSRAVLGMLAAQTLEGTGGHGPALAGYRIGAAANRPGGTGEER